LADKDNDGNLAYNGKEFLDDLDIGWHYYGFRVYDPAIARFTSVDPISDQFPNLSTFNYADNNPILNIDLHGLQGVKYTELDKKGREITVIEADIHIATGKGGFSDKQVRRITKKLNKAFDKKVDGTRVDVRFNVSTFDASNTNLKDKARKVRNSSLVKTAVTFETLEGTMTKSSITGMVLGKEALPAGDQGKTNVNLSVINPEADDMMHTTVHEVGHFLLLGSNEQPASFPEHQEAGGIFKYATKDLSGNVVGETHGVSRNNVRAILKNVPEKKQ